MATTYHQQARHFNAPEVNIALPTLNTLHTMPSMSHLSSTQTDLAQTNDSHDNDNHVQSQRWKNHSEQHQFQ
jgi:hypothetical protein